MAATWHAELDAVLLCGDVGTFTHDSQLDNATRSHAKLDPGELEFLRQWAVAPQPAWIKRIFQPSDQGGRGLECPVVMVHGNHEGFEHLEKLIPSAVPNDPIAMSSLPTVDTGGYIRYLPSGWRCVSPSGLVVGGVGGMERGQRRVHYHEMAYIDEEAVLRLLDGPKLDVLITHQGPSETQGDKGSELLQPLLDAGIARVWFHGHAIPNPEVRTVGETTVVPLGGATFLNKGADAGDPGPLAWARVESTPAIQVDRSRASSWREFRRRHWRELPNGQLVWPGLL